MLSIKIEEYYSLPKSSLSNRSKLVHLDHKRTAINRVDDDPSAGERVVTPSSKGPVRDSTAWLVIIFGVDVEEGNLFDALAGGVTTNGRDVEDTETGLIVGLVGETVVDELVVVDGTGLGFVEAGVDGFLEVADVENVCYVSSVPVSFARDWERKNLQTGKPSLAGDSGFVRAGSMKPSSSSSSRIR